MIFKFFEKYSSKHLEGTEILYTFASALQNKPLGKLLKAVKKEFFEKIYINREVVQEASICYFISDRWVKETNRSIYCLCFSSITTKYRLKIKVLFT